MNKNLGRIIPTNFKDDLVNKRIVFLDCETSLDKVKNVLENRKDDEVIVIDSLTELQMQLEDKVMRDFIKENNSKEKIWRRRYRKYGKVL